MVPIMKNGMRRIRYGRLLAAAVVAFVLSGCASRLTVQTTRFQQWPSNAQNASYAIAPTLINEPEQQPLTPQAVDGRQTQALPELQAKTYEAYLAQSLQAQGLVPAARPEQARMLARMTVQSRRSMVARRVPVVRPSLWLGFGGGHWRYGGYFSYPWGYYDDYDWGERIVQQPIQSYRLRVHIADRGQAAATRTTAPAVFEGSAEYTGRPVALNQIMPYLLRAIFNGFPGVSGQTQQVQFDTHSGELVPSKKP